MLKNYITNLEYRKFTGLSGSAALQNSSVITCTIGSMSFVLKSSVPQQYKHILKDCIDLSMYLPTAYFCTLIGMSRTFIGSLKIYHNLKFDEIELSKRRYLFKVTAEFLELLDKDKVFCKVTDKDDLDDFEGFIEVQGIKIGWY